MKALLTLLSICLVFTACHKSSDCKPDNGSGFDCLAFKTGIVINDDAAVSAEIEKLTADLFPAATSSTDPYGQAQNINVLVQRLSAQCDVTATLICYACIKTYPAQSEIRVVFTMNGTAYSRVLDISFTPQNMLTYVHNHE
jgi:hypothetical protein